MIFYECAMVLIYVIIAYIHSRLILHNKPIVHWLWVAIYFAILGFEFWFTHSWWLLIASIQIRELLFAQALNKLRGKKWFYVSPTSGSIIDKVEGKYYKYIYFGSLAVFIVAQYELFKSKKQP